jgi:hypothetical protein
MSGFRVLGCFGRFGGIRLPRCLGRVLLWRRGFRQCFQEAGFFRKNELRRPFGLELGAGRIL